MGQGSCERPASGGPARVLSTFEAIWIGSIACDGDTLYVGALGGGLYRVDKASGKAERIASTGNPRAIAIDAGTVLWQDGAVYEAPKDAPGGAPAPARYTAGDAASLAVDATHLYWHDGRSIWRRAKHLADKNLVAHTGHLGVVMAVDGAHLYWGDDAIGAMFRWPTAGGPLELVSGDWTFGGTLVSDGDWLYVAGIDTAIREIRKSDGRARTLIASALSVPNKNGLALVADETQLFLAVHASRWDTSSAGAAGGVAHIDLTRSDATIPPSIPLGVVARMPRHMQGGEARERPSSVRLATVYFSATSEEPQDIANATSWLGANRRLAEALASGNLELRLVTSGPSSLTRKRLDRVARALRSRLGERAQIIQTARPGTESHVTLEVDPSAYANVWAPAR